MNELKSSFRFRINNEKYLFWGKILSKFISVQLVVQVLGGITSILLVRTLAKEEYAYYTIINSMQGTLSLLTDMGLSAGILSIGGKIWQDKYRLSQLISTAFSIRKSLAVFAGVIVIPVLNYLLIKNGASILYSSLLSLLFIFILFFQLQVNIWTIVLRLLGQIERLQKMDLLSAIIRCVFLFVISLIFLNTSIAVAITGIAFVAQYALVKKWTYENIDHVNVVNEDDKKELKGLIKSQAANGIFFCFQSQLITWLISIAGNVQSIAEVGALSRLELIFTLMSSVMNAIFLPIISKTHDKSALRKKFGQILFFYSFVGATLILFSYLFPEVILFVLGPKYAHLKEELLLMVIGLALGGVVAILWSMNLAKGWVEYSWLYIPSTILTQFLLILLLDLSLVQHVILFGIFSKIPNLLLNIFLSYRGFVFMDKAYNLKS